MLNTLSGNGEAQRNGLQQAFSDGLGMPVTIGALNKFNAIPQFYIDMNDIQAGSIHEGYYLNAEQFVVAFSLFDIFFNKKTIQEFQIKNGEFRIPNLSEDIFKNVNVQILRPELTKPARLFLQATLKEKPIEITISMHHSISNLNYNYNLSNKEQIIAKSGTCEITGTFDQSAMQPFIWNLPTTINDDCVTIISLFK